MGLEETSKVSKRMTRRASTRLGNCNFRSSRRKWRSESFIAVDICRVETRVTIARGDGSGSLIQDEREGSRTRRCS